MMNMQPMFFPQQPMSDGFVSLKAIYDMFMASIEKRVPELKEEAENVMLKSIGLYRLNTEQCTHGNMAPHHYTLLRNALKDCIEDEATLEFIKFDVFSDYGQYVLENVGQQTYDPKVLCMESKVKAYIDSITTISMEKKNDLDVSHIAKECIEQIENASTMDPSYTHDDIDDIVKEHVDDTIMDML